jgi:diguanylate cyclase (GGDEF)-like protein
MTDSRDAVRVKNVSRLGALCVLTLEAGDVEPTFHSTVEDVATGAVQIMVIDCLDLDALPAPTCIDLINAHERLAAGDRHLIVVNAPEQARPQLRYHGVDLATTASRPVGVDPSRPAQRDAQLLWLDLAEAATARDDAVARRDRLEAESDNRATPEDGATSDDLLSARDRAAAALDRYDAAVDRLQAAVYLEQTYRDELTGALQRKAGTDQLAREISRAHRGGTSLVIAFIDVDHLKTINDIEGHASGDGLLAALGRALATGLRSYDLVIRFGGDEFVCALPEVSLEAARRRITQVQLRLSLARPGATISIGLATLEPNDDLDAVLRRADEDLYRNRAESRTVRTPHQRGADA